MFSYKRISDPVHGTIGLSELELTIINSKAFQRIRGVKQLGLAHLVYPGADYSRFSHSLGVCHLTGMIIDAINSNSRKDITEAEVQKYRLAALLHDVGHYPFSHAMEDALHNYYSKALFRRKNVADQGSSQDEKISTDFFRHEQVGKHVVHNDPEIVAALKTARLVPEEISSIFLRENPPIFSNLVSSDLDADRIDYLLRTAHYTGLPYGNVDVNYLLSQIRVDNDGHVCFTSKAIRTAEHFLLSRYFDYQQVSFHKTVAALELVLKDVIAALLEEGLISCSSQDIDRMIQSGEWKSFDDNRIHRRIVELSENSENELIKEKALAVLLRRNPKLICETEALKERSTDSKEVFLSQNWTLDISSWP